MTYLRHVRWIFRPVVGPDTNRRLRRVFGRAAYTEFLLPPLHEKGAE
jgi:hypothetical protein